MAEAANPSKPTISWLGHAGFVIRLTDESGTARAIYIDPWIGNPKYPEHLKVNGECPDPTDADLVLITHGHWDHSGSAVPIQTASGEKCKIACGFELG